MRAGLLSDSRVIKLINEKFVSTWVLIDDLKQRTETEHPLAKTLSDNWEYPLDLMFLTPEGQFVTKLNSFDDLPQAHPDVGHHANPRLRFEGRSHTEVFLDHVQKFLEGN